MQKVLEVNKPKIKIGKSTNRMGDVDFVFYNDDLLVLGETKSSPLVLYPLKIELDRELTEIRDGKKTSKREHTVGTTNIDDYEVHFYLPHIEESINLGKPNTENWPFEKLTQFVQKEENVLKLIAAWYDLYKVYEENLIRGNTDNRKWLTCGCGSTVDDSKNKPGMDRTDDIKKGTYQTLKFGTYYKEKSPNRVIKSILASNFFPLRTYQRYLAEMVDVIWTKDKYTIEIEELENKVVFDENDIFNLYDGVICFTTSVYKDETIEASLNLENFIENLCN